MNAQVAQSDDGWLLPLGGAQITRLEVDNRFSLLLSGGDFIVIEAPLRYGTQTESLHIDPEDTAQVAGLLDLLHQIVHRVTIQRSGILRLELADRRKIEVPTIPRFESWQVILADGQLFIGSPGGGVAIYPPHANPQNTTNRHTTPQQLNPHGRLMGLLAQLRRRR
jgi:hypothetical protein